MENNEIVDITLIGSVDQQTRQFLVRRQRCLEVMYTNGLNFWKHLVDDSQVQQPSTIRNVMINKSNDKIIVFYSEQDKKDSVKFFKMEGKRFKAYDDLEGGSVQEFSNICIDKQGKIFEVLTEIKTKKYQKPEKNIEVIKIG